MFGKKVVFLHINYIHVYLLSLISYKPEYGNYNKLKKDKPKLFRSLGYTNARLVCNNIFIANKYKYAYKTCL